jgi:acyl-CoA reductase-like NAD-dependent aldehyde dehydrogenase
MDTFSGTSPVPFWLAGQAKTGKDIFDVRHPYDNSLVAQVALATSDDIEQAAVTAALIADDLSAQPAHLRAAALDHVSAELSRRHEEVVNLITAESGKPLKWARIEVTRAISTFRFAAEEARRFSGELQRLDTDPVSNGRIAITRRHPRGPILGIAPFNFPLNLVAHKVAPAIAVGAPIVVKPSPRTPLSALLLGEILAEIDLPKGAISVLTVLNEQAELLTNDPRLPVVSFTGSVPIGWSIRRAVPDKQVILELGGNAAVIVTDDYSDLDWAAQRIATFANYQAGQSCISVQRVFIAANHYEELVAKIVSTIESLGTGDPRDEKTDVGPLIDTAAADRIEQWIAEAVKLGAQVLTGGARTGNTITPTVLAKVLPSAKVNTEEVFGPVLTVAPFTTLDEAFDQVNDSIFGLQAGIFTTRIATAFAAQQRLKVGGVIVGDVPSYRADQMAYGGSKASGIGREGVRYTMDEFTEPRTMVLTGVVL